MKIFFLTEKPYKKNYHFYLKKRKWFFLFISISLLFSSIILFSFIHGEANSQSHSHHLPSKKFKERINEDKDVLHLLEMERRVLGEGEKDSKAQLTILAANRTQRRDPLDDFKYYKGGWDYKNKHYYSSTAFTGAPMYVAASICVVIAFLYTCICFCWCCCCCCCWHRDKHHGYSRAVYVISQTSILLATIFAIAGAGYLYSSQVSFQNSSKDILKYIIERAQNTFERVRRVTTDLSEAYKLSDSQKFIPPEIQGQLQKLEQVTNFLDKFEVTENKDIMKGLVVKFLTPTGISLMIMVTITLAVALIGVSFALCGMHYIVYVITILSWLLVSSLFILAGVSFVIHNAVGDACVGMAEWVKTPTADSTLKQVLPCVDKETTQGVLQISRNVTLGLVTNVNALLNSMVNKDLPPDQLKGTPLFYNQSGPPVPLLCNPLNPDQTPRKCANAEIELRNANKEMKKYVCEITAQAQCKTQGRLVPEMYNYITAIARVSGAIYKDGPFLADLADCTFVKDTVQDINEKHCPHLKLYTFNIFLGLLTVAVSVAISTSLWLVYAREKRRKTYTRRTNVAYYMNPI